MKKRVILTLLCILFVSLHAQEPSRAKIVKLSKKGEKIVGLLCERQKLPSAKGTIDEIRQRLIQSHACKPLSKRKLEAVAYYLSHGSAGVSAAHLHLPDGAKCPVCGMFVTKYPKWAAMIEENGRRHYFDGVKDMMKYYIFDADFPYDRSRISHIMVTDFYTLDAIPAKEAYFVYDGTLYGPMGRELVPFATEKAARNFMVDHAGKKILRFDEITPQLVMALDGIDFSPGAME